MQPVRVSTREQIAHAIAMFQQAGEGFRVPLFQAAFHGALALTLVCRGQRVPYAIMDLAGKPSVILLSDDQPAATGPDAWPQARRLLEWARFGMLHAAAGEAVHYAVAADAALLHRRVLIVEMEQRHHAAWFALAQPLAPPRVILSILPPAGVQHPVPGAPPGVVVQ